jgi:hypothetical protein
MGIELTRSAGEENGGRVAALSGGRSSAGRFARLPSGRLRVGCWSSIPFRPFVGGGAWWRLRLGPHINRSRQVIAF